MLEENQRVQLEKNSYTLIELIGEGGQGVIWTVRAETTGEMCVLKTIRTYQTSQSGRQQAFDTHILNELSRRMQEEIDFLRAIKDKKNCFIANCLDYGIIHSEVADLPTMIMPYYSHSLQQQIPRETGQQPHYDLHTLLKWLSQLSQALQCTHEQIIDGQAYMHRDIKPANVLVTEKSEVRLIDFGIARQQSDDAGTTSIAHSPAWAAPEQVLPEFVHENGKNVFRLTEKTDLYSLGLVAYYLCTGGTEPRQQAKLRDNSQSIYTEHVIALSRGEKGKLGQIGGLNDKDCAYLERKLLTLFFDEDKEMVDNHRVTNEIPLSYLISHQIVDFIKQLVSPQAIERPTAEMAKKRFRQLQCGLSPCLKDFSVQASKTDLMIDESLVLDVSLSGKGLIAPQKWLSVYDQNNSLLAIEEWSIDANDQVFLPENSKVTIRLCLEAFKVSGAYSLRVVACIGENTQSFEVDCVVRASAQQLWQQGQHEAALQQELRKEWLDVLEKEAESSVVKRYPYLQLLKSLQHSVDDNVQKENLMKRYDRMNNIGKPNRWRIVALLSGVVMLLIVLMVFVLPTFKPVENTASTKASTTMKGDEFYVLSGFKVGIYFLSANQQVSELSKNIANRLKSKGFNGNIQRYEKDAEFFNKVVMPKTNEIRYDIGTEEKQADFLVAFLSKQYPNRKFVKRAVRTSTQTKSFISIFIDHTNESIDVAEKELSLCEKYSRFTAEQWENNYLQQTQVGTWHVFVASLGKNTTKDKAIKIAEDYNRKFPNHKFKHMATANAANVRYAIVLAEGIKDKVIAQEIAQYSDQCNVVKGAYAYQQD